MIRICCIGIVSSLSAAVGVELVQSDGEARFVVGGAELLVLSTPWVATPDWKDLYRFPDNLGGSVEKKDGKRIVTTRSRGGHGNVTQIMTIGAESMSGPLGIVSIGGKIARSGLVEFLYFLAIISANLAVINFLPLPIVHRY